MRLPDTVETQLRNLEDVADKLLTSIAPYVADVRQFADRILTHVGAVRDAIAAQPETVAPEQQSTPDTPESQKDSNPTAE